MEQHGDTEDALDDALHLDHYSNYEYSNYIYEMHFWIVMSLTKAITLDGHQTLDDDDEDDYGGDDS